MLQKRATDVTYKDKSAQFHTENRNRMVQTFKNRSLRKETNVKRGF